MKAYVFQHVPFEGLGCIQSWLDQNQYQTQYIRMYEDPVLPSSESVDLLIILGGPMSVNEEAAFPWLKKEKEFIRKIIDAKIPLLGICLGAQLIASALGKQVHPNWEKEIGWFEIQRVPSPSSTFSFPEKATVFQWHEDTFEIPDDAIHLATSIACKNQAFQLDRRTIGLQFHLETSLETMELLLESSTNELETDQTFVQSPDEMRRLAPQKAADSNQLMFDLLDYLTK